MTSTTAFLHQRMPSGAIFKIAVGYDEPFWRNDGLSGQSHRGAVRHHRAAHRAPSRTRLRRRAVDELADFGHPLREPCGRIHWAGTEISAVMCGWVDGAIRSGERAATEVMRREQLTMA